MKGEKQANWEAKKKGGGDYGSHKFKENRKLKNFFLCKKLIAFWVYIEERNKMEDGTKKQQNTGEKNYNKSCKCFGTTRDDAVGSLYRGGRHVVIVWEEVIVRRRCDAEIQWYFHQKNRE